MPGIPPQLEAMINRMYAKGTKFQYGITNNPGAIPTQWASIASVKKIGGPDKKRQGPVDCTELAPQMGFDGGDPGEGGTGVFPVDTEAGLALNRTAESYYWTKYGPGTKDCQPLTISMNFPKDILFYLNYWFDYDIYLWWRILYTNGAYHRFFGFIEELPVNSEDNTLVNGDVQFRPLDRIIFNPGGQVPAPAQQINQLIA